MAEAPGRRRLRSSPLASRIRRSRRDSHRPGPGGAERDAESDATATGCMCDPRHPACGRRGTTCAMVADDCHRPSAGCDRAARRRRGCPGGRGRCGRRRSGRRGHWASGGDRQRQDQLYWDDRSTPFMGRSPYWERCFRGTSLAAWTRLPSARQRTAGRRAAQPRCHRRLRQATLAVRCPGRELPGSRAQVRRDALPGRGPRCTTPRGRPMRTPNA